MNALERYTITPVLPPAEQRRLEKLMPTSPTARDKMVLGNMAFVVDRAKHYVGNGLPLDDLIQEGMIGLMTAAKKFDPSHGVRFISYAVWWVNRHISVAIQQKASVIRQPINRQAERYQVQQHRNTKMQQTLAYVTTAEAIRDIWGKDRQGIEHYVIYPDADLWDEHHSHGLYGREEKRYWDALASSPQNQTYDDTTDAIRAAIATLTPREQDILARYYEGETLQQIADTYNLTRERIRQVKEQALARLRRRLPLDKLKETALS